MKWKLQSTGLTTWQNKVPWRPDFANAFRESLMDCFVVKGRKRPIAKILSFRKIEISTSTWPLSRDSFVVSHFLTAMAVSGSSGQG